MTEFAVTGNDPKERDAMQRIEAFRNHFTEAHLEFACHAAFPLALTPDLLYRLRDYPFNPKLQVPWIAVSDLLLSGLCSEVDEELYEMDSTVRKVLLSGLSQQRLRELSKFLLKYVKRNFQSKISGLKQAQYWIALAYVEPGKAAEQLTRTLGQLLQRPNLAQWLQKSSLVETLADPLRDANFQPLLILAEAMKQTALGDYTEATRLFDRLPKIGESAIIAGVQVTLPSRPIPAETFTFETVMVNSKGEIIQRETKQASYFTEDLGYDTKLEMVYIPRGRFWMGSPKTEANNYEHEQPQNQVTIKPFFMGKYSITQAQWRAVAKLPKIHYDLDPDPSFFKGENRPVESISWYHAVEFCARLSQKTGRIYRLPSEAEWEYACRAGTTTPFHFGETITTDLANYRGRDYTDIKNNNRSGSYGQGPKGIYRLQTTPVGSFDVANAYGLYDMHGNLWEWCIDEARYGRSKGTATDSSDWDDNSNNNLYPTFGLLANTKNDRRVRRIVRGGSWTSNPWLCRSVVRLHNDADDYYSNYGFRVVCVAAWT